MKRGIGLGLVGIALALTGARGIAAPKEGPAAGKEMTRAIAALNQSLGLESYPEPHCLQRDFGKMVKLEQVKECAERALKENSAQYPELGKSYVIAVLMAEVGPSTILAISQEAPGWAVLSCDPGKPCPPRRSGTDKMGARVSDRIDRACKNSTTVWYPSRSTTCK